MEQSLVLIKPDATKRNIVGKIIAFYESNGLVVKQIKKLTVSRELAEMHYEEHIGKYFFEDLIDYITTGEVVAMVLEGENAVSRIRDLNGATNPEDAKEGTVRKLFAISRRENSVHASDSIESAERELKLWFN